MKLSFLIANTVFTIVLVIVLVRLGLIVWGSAIGTPDKMAIVIVFVAFMVGEFSELSKHRLEYYRQRIEEERAIGRMMRGE